MSGEPPLKKYRDEINAPTGSDLQEWQQKLTGGADSRATVGLRHSASVLRLLHQQECSPLMYLSALGLAKSFAEDNNARSTLVHLGAVSVAVTFLRRADSPAISQKAAELLVSLVQDVDGAAALRADDAGMVVVASKLNDSRISPALCNVLQAILIDEASAGKFSSSGAVTAISSILTTQAIEANVLGILQRVISLHVVPLADDLITILLRLIVDTDHVNAAESAAAIVSTVSVKQRAVLLRLNGLEPVRSVLFNSKAPLPLRLLCAIAATRLTEGTALRDALAPVAADLAENAVSLLRAYLSGERCLGIRWVEPDRAGPVAAFVRIAFDCPDIRAKLRVKFTPEVMRELARGDADLAMWLDMLTDSLNAESTAESATPPGSPDT
eukprot:TRINITY_DN11769_c0_g1_i1.p1 TRINITY_DN11769_c0_g1~~TRINITY_DN11769_c0_g1_i1.p1  ORF type:complete len:396 (-),score=51.05 TRINITY_DN11769_c0_g1_i1:26-1180(-)